MDNNFQILFMAYVKVQGICNAFKHHGVKVKTSRGISFTLVFVNEKFKVFHFRRPPQVYDALELKMSVPHFDIHAPSHRIERFHFLFPARVDAGDIKFGPRRMNSLHASIFENQAFIILNVKGRTPTNR
jgi:hypothetical protein